MGKKQKDYKAVNYEGYGPHGIAVFVETATDNSTRTVANVRSYFNKCGGSLGVSGSVDFMFKHLAMFTILKKEGMDLEEFLLELIDFDIDEEYDVEGDEITIYAPFQAFNAVQTFLEENGYEIKNSEFTRIPMDEKELEGEAREEVEKLIERLEDDEDVQAVYTTLKPSDSEEEEA